MVHANPVTDPREGGRGVTEAGSAPRLPASRLLNAVPASAAGRLVAKVSIFGHTYVCTPRRFRHVVANIHHCSCGEKLESLAIKRLSRRSVSVFHTLGYIKPYSTTFNWSLKVLLLWLIDQLPASFLVSWRVGGSQDMKKLEKEKKIDHVRLMMKFKDDYPFSPPFVRIVYPRFKRSTGYIIDGAFCMELLTNQVREQIREI